MYNIFEKEEKRKTITELVSRDGMDRLIDRKVVIQAIEARREELGLNKTEWSQVLGMNQTCYSEATMPLGRRFFTVDQLRRAFIAGVPAEKLLGFED